MFSYKVTFPFYYYLAVWYLRIKYCGYTVAAGLPYGRSLRPKLARRR